MLPNLSPYLNGRVEADGRPPCPSPSIVAQTGYYLSDLSCPIGPHTWRSALRSTHSAVAAADHVAGTAARPMRCAARPAITPTATAPAASAT